MLSPTNLDTLTTKLQTSPINIYREYLQHLFLRAFYQQKSASGILFKGGTALRIVFQSPRFSEDLDFSLVHSDLALIESAIENTLLNISYTGLNISLIEATPTSGGYVSQINCLLGDLSIDILLEFSTRKQNMPGETTTINNDFIPLYPILHLNQSHLVAEKVQALLSRQKPRDFYDLYFLLRKNMLSPTDKTHLTQIKTLLTQTTLNFQSELREFLPHSHWIIIKNFKHTLSQELDRFIR